jgi:hypothetical protein
MLNRYFDVLFLLFSTSELESLDDAIRFDKNEDLATGTAALTYSFSSLIYLSLDIEVSISFKHFL